jgi:hypothetical protein
MIITQEHRDFGEKLANLLRHDRVPGLRMDAAVATMFVAKQLEYVSADVTNTAKYALKARTFLPVDPSAHPGSQTIAIDTMDSMGEAEITDDYAGDSPGVGAIRERSATLVAGLRAHYAYSIQDMRAAQMAGVPLEVELAAQARRAIEAKLDRIALRGDAKINRTGFANDANVSVYATALNWTSATTAEDMLDGMNAFVSSVKEKFGDIEENLDVDTLIVPTGHWQLMNNKTFANRPDITALKAFLANQAYVRNVAPWGQLNQLGAGSTPGAPIGRFICYRRDPAVVRLNIPQDYEEFPEVKGLKFNTECHLRTAGTVIRRVLAVGYADGTSELS